MKKLLGLAMAVLLFASCSDDNNNEPAVDVSKLTSGKWFRSSTRYPDNGQMYLHDNLCPTSRDYVVFNTDGTITSVYYFEDCIFHSDNSGTYTLVGKRLTIGGSESLIITKLTSSTLVVSGYDMDGDGVSSNSIEFTYTR
ncbi:lipocalin family protein [Flavobacterium sp. RHBU_24]|uniref:lipocalin family protein n=1 Tax=Flavobacterium sp. RHBU_24 TaxID=3391185 RepID=UPI003984713B